MQTYNLRQIALDQGARKGSRVLITPVHAPLSSELQYVRALRKMLRSINQTVREYVLPRYRELRAAGMLLDARVNDINASIFAELLSGKSIWTATSAAMVQAILEREGDRHTMQFNAAIKASLGVDMSAVLSSGDIRDLVRSTSAFSASLITNLANESIQRIENIVYQAAITGESYSSLAMQIRESAGISDRRANLIARDQVQKFNGNLNKIRQEQLGITEYEWITVGDSKVRRDHAERNGKIFKWANPPSDGNPGEAINCRCTSGAVIQF